MQNQNLYRLKILFMDDDAIVRQVAAAMFDLLGHEVHVVSDGSQAISLYDREKRAGRPFHLVILDIHVPGGMGGSETIARLRELSPGVRAIISSGLGKDPLMIDFKNYGFVGALLKPYTLKELAAAVTELFQRTRIFFRRELTDY